MIRCIGVLFLLAGFKPALNAQVDLFACRLQVNGLTVYQDARDSSRFFYLPDSFFIVTDEDRIAHEGLMEYAFQVKLDENARRSGGVYQAVIDFGLLPDQLASLKDDLHQHFSSGVLAGAIPVLRVTGSAKTAVSDHQKELPLGVHLIPEGKALISLHLNRNEVKILEGGYWDSKYPIFYQPQVQFLFEGYARFSAQLPWDSLQPALLKGDTLSPERIKTWLVEKSIRLKNLKGDDLDLYSWELEPVAGLLKEAIDQRQHYFPPLDSSGYWTLVVKNKPVLIYHKIQPDFLKSRQKFQNRFSITRNNLQFPFRIRQVYFFPEGQLLDMIRDNSLDLDIDWRVRLMSAESTGFYVFEHRYVDSDQLFIEYPYLLSKDWLKYENQLFYQLQEGDNPVGKKPIISKTVWEPQDRPGYAAHEPPGFISTKVYVEFEPDMVKDLVVQGVKVEFFAEHEKQSSLLKKVFFLPLVDYVKGKILGESVQLLLPKESLGVYFYKVTWFLESGEVLESRLNESSSSMIFVDEIKK